MVMRGRVAAMACRGLTTVLVVVCGWRGGACSYDRTLPARITCPDGISCPSGYACMRGVCCKSTSSEVCPPGGAGGAVGGATGAGGGTIGTGGSIVVGTGDGVAGAGGNRGSGGLLSGAGGGMGGVGGHAGTGGRPPGTGGAATGTGGDTLGTGGSLSTQCPSTPSNFATNGYGIYNDDAHDVHWHGCAYTDQGGDRAGDVMIAPKCRITPSNMNIFGKTAVCVTEDATPCFSNKGAPLCASGSIPANSSGTFAQFGWDLNADPTNVSNSEQVVTSGDGLFINAPGAERSMEVHLFGTSGEWCAPMPGQGGGMIPWGAFVVCATKAGSYSNGQIQGVTIVVNGGSQGVVFCFCVVDIHPYWL